MKFGEDDATFSADDLALLDDPSGDDPSDADQGEKTGQDDLGDPVKAKTPPQKDELNSDATDTTDAKKKRTLASGEESPPPKEPEGYWPEDWREKVAEHIAAGDKKAYDKELRRLQRVTDPAGIYGNYRELDNRLNGGGLIKVPGKDATPEEIADYHKALGVPEEAKDYLDNVQLQNGAVIGDADKPMLEGVLTAVHKAGATQPVVDAMVNWYYSLQEEQAAELDETDDAFQRESENVLKEELGPAFKRSINAIAPLFAIAPGGSDVSNDESLYARLMGGRMADGRVIGNDPDMVRFLIGLAHEVNPAATVTEDGDQSGKTIDGELAEIQKLRTENPKKYWSESVQTRELELITAQQKLQAKA